MLNKDRRYSRAGAPTLIALVALAGPAGLRAQGESPLAGSFGELFPNPGRPAPVFTRPEVILRLPMSSPAPGESAPAPAEPARSAQPTNRADDGERQDEAVASAPIRPIIPRPAAEVVEIRINGSADGARVWFDPVGVLLQPGQTVRFVNRDPVYAHTATAYHPKNFDRPRGIPERAEPWNSGYLLPDQTFSVRLTEEGVYDYFCIPHEKAGMVGRIVVKHPAGASEQPFAAAALEGAARAVPERARRAFPSVEEIIRHGAVRAHAAAPPGDRSAGSGVVAPRAERRAALSRDTGALPSRRAPASAAPEDPHGHADAAPAAAGPAALRPPSASTGPRGGRLPARRSAETAESAESAEPDGRRAASAQDPDRTRAGPRPRIQALTAPPGPPSRRTLDRTSRRSVARVDEQAGGRAARANEDRRPVARRPQPRPAPLPDVQRRPAPELPRELRL